MKECCTHGFLQKVMKKFFINGASLQQKHIQVVILHEKDLSEVLNVLALCSQCRDSSCVKLTQVSNTEMVQETKV